MRVFEIINPKTRSEFLVEVSTGNYVGKVNGQVVCASSDYESVRSNIIKKYNDELGIKDTSCECFH